MLRERSPVPQVVGAWIITPHILAARGERGR